MPLDMNGKTIIVTGASKGIGEATARKCIAYGANVILAARSKDKIEKIAKELGDCAIAVVCDVANYDEVAKVVDMAITRFGSVDILVNNASLIDPIARIESSPIDAWGQVIDVNVKGVFNGLKAGFEALKQSNGVVINISSGAATNVLEGWSAYCASKAAVLSLTKSAHLEWAQYGIRVVGLSPGTVATDMQKAIKKSGINPVSKIDWNDHISPEWVAEAIAWLTTEGGRAFDGTDFMLRSDENRKLVGLI